MFHFRHYTHVSCFECQRRHCRNGLMSLYARLANGSIEKRNGIHIPQPARLVSGRIFVRAGYEKLLTFLQDKDCCLTLPSSRRSLKRRTPTLFTMLTSTSSAFIRTTKPLKTKRGWESMQTFVHWVLLVGDPTMVIVPERCSKSGSTTQNGDFLRLFDLEKIVEGPWFCIRQEILCVLENFKKVFLDTNSARQFVLMRILLYRNVAVGLKPSMTRLFYSDVLYEWEDDSAGFCQSLHSDVEAINGWFCLDGMNENTVKLQKWKRKYNELAASGQFSVQNFAEQSMCVLPYWHQNDPTQFGSEYCKMDESDIPTRFYSSGGSFREFLSDNTVNSVAAAISTISWSDDAERLLLNDGLVVQE
ncbi:hypothetical protein Ae201684_002377 [Aphanomyces euteiches]|uniref:Uncharacterized protein n=1 Tax=Aphanomyces euteiches TaxID=100861 RepID=A0A6G0XQP4_9STRA|nr:hypothetical protein Ae201684_002377 [Aphanomyces euteiches]